ncbi:uncharacterized protein LOC131259529 isoform X2 [Anopheles coustani]|uniref:uncharacterized protein LOC131259529 isoform X2 n=1 Tax=Anopheles coustani TaxID=139045 RepID=UPI002658BE53|nr:uncharacterized protein LOC131259529 isoform X2 [Anopheles coustani]
MDRDRFSGSLAIVSWYCRICTTTSGVDCPIYEAPNEDEGTASLHMMLAKLFPTVFNESQVLSDKVMDWPSKICLDCKGKVIESYGLYELCTKSAQQLALLVAKQQTVTHTFQAEVDDHDGDIKMKLDCEDPLMLKVEYDSDDQSSECRGFESLSSTANVFTDIEDGQSTTESSLLQGTNVSSLAIKTQLNRSTKTAEVTPHANIAVQKTVKVSRKPRGRIKTTSAADRERVIDAYDSGLTPSLISQFLSIKRSTVYGILRNYWNTGEIEAKKRGGIKTKKLSSSVSSTIRLWMDEDSSLTLRKLREKVKECYGIEVSATTIARELHSFHYSFKRFIAERPITTSTIDLKKYALSYSQLELRLPQDAITFIHEVGFNIIMRIVQNESNSADGTSSTTKPETRTFSKNISIVCAMRRCGILYFECKKRAIDLEGFTKFIRELKEKLNDPNAGHRPVLLMDEGAFHRCSDISDALSREGFEAMFLPPNFCLLNPIERLFDKWNIIVKKENPQNEEQLVAAIQRVGSLITAEDCDSYFNNMHDYIEKCTLAEGMTA